MAKNIKTIQCPKCGSVKKTLIQPDHFKCDNCDTDYFLDDDDINININHRNIPYPQPPPVAPPRKNLLVLVLVILIIPLVIFMVNIFSTTEENKQAENEEPKYRFGSAGEYVYRNLKSGKAVFMRIGREFIDDEDPNVDVVNTHVLFIDPMSGKVLKDDLLFSRIRRLDDYFPSFRRFTDGSIYMLYPGSKLFMIDRNTDELKDVTKSQFKNHQELSAGLATIEFNDDYFNLLTNDGNKFYYFPKKDLLTTDYDEIKAAVKETQPTPFFDFENDVLMKTTNGSSDDFTPSRKYFNPELLFQGKNWLIISVTATASSKAPLLLQRIDAKSGKLLWSLPGRQIYYDSAADCNEGIAVEYSAGQELNYISGILMISPEGKIIKDYLLARGE